MFYQLLDEDQPDLLGKIDEELLKPGGIFLLADWEQGHYVTILFEKTKEKLEPRRLIISEKECARGKLYYADPGTLSQLKTLRGGFYCPETDPRAIHRICIHRYD